MTEAQEQTIEISGKITKEQMAQIVAKTGMTEQQVMQKLAEIKKYPPVNQDPLMEAFQTVAADVGRLGQIFDENDRRLKAKNIGVEPDQQELANSSELKALIDAQIALVNLEIEMRREQREEMQWHVRTAPEQPKDPAFGFSGGTKAVQAAKAAKIAPPKR